MITTLRHNSTGLSKTTIILLLGGVVVIMAGIILIALSSRATPPPKKVNLTMWGVWDDSSDVEEMINAYHNSHPYITITYVKKRMEEYEDALLKGWATDTGPDIYALPNTWINKYRSEFITPIPASTKIAFYTTKKILFKTETSIDYVTRNSLTPQDIKRDFIEVVYGDTVFDNQLYALPLGINTLVMFYNKSLLNQAHLAQPPRTWGEFSSTISKIAVVNDQNTIVRAGAALGTYTNIPRAVDIVTLLMLQNGATMFDGKNITFDRFNISDAVF